MNPFPTPQSSSITTTNKNAYVNSVQQKRKTVGQSIAFEVSSKKVYVVMDCVVFPKFSYLRPNSQHLRMYLETGPLKRQ